MKAHERYQALIRCVLLFVFVIFVSGCGGGATSGGNESTGGNQLPGGGNQPPGGTSNINALVYADAGDIIGVRVNENVVLNGSGSGTTTTDPLTYVWSFTSKPDTSNAVLQNPTLVNPSFIADVKGTYMVQLVVSAGGISSQRAIASVEVTIDGNFTGDKRVHTSFPSRCADCHDGHLAEGDGVIDPVLPKSGNHLATSNVCEACHTTFGFNLIRYVDHLEVFGKCSTCHNGVLAITKSEFHVATNAECDNCHTTSSFLPLGADGSYDHTGITRACATCHNGTTAIGKHEVHFVTEADCGSCHTTTNFVDAYVNHSTITARCDSCHNGTDALGQTAGHPVMGVLDCSSCHSTTRFSLNGVYNHRIDTVELSCENCHNGNNSINARGKSDSPTAHVATTADCGVCHGVGGGDFALGILDHSDPTVLAQSCDSCHGVTATGKPVPNHMPTTADCSVCHTVGTFVTGFFDHNASVVDPIACASCHEGTITAGKNVNHVPTIEDCRICHLSTDTFVGAIFNHTGIINGCASCHDGNISPGKSLNHLPTTRDCSDCHDIANFVDFTGATFDHQGVGNNCATCHDGVIAISKKVNHIPAQTECSQCHIDTSTGGFATSIFMSDVHPGFSNGCEGCHTSRFFPLTPAVVKAATHLPTNQDCHACHTNVAFNPNIFNHSGIASNCASCHDGNYVTPAGALGKTIDHPVTTDDCGVCHGIGANFLDGIFDHSGTVDNCASCHGDGAAGATTKKHAAHVPTSEDCSVCHVPGTFATAVFSHAGIVDNCASCHDGSVATARVKTANHLPTTEDCSICHNTTAFAGARYDHQGIVDNCATCHDGDIATGKGGAHVPTNDDCSVCHLTTGFIPGTFDHVGIVDNCQSCHDGSLAQGKIIGHVATNEDCGVCHTTRGFIPATFDHSTVTNSTRCDSCHIDGSSSATGKDDKVNPVHIPTGLDCRSCHTTATFVGGTWTHDGSSVGVCDTCHNGIDATPKPSQGHISTDIQCDECHSTDGWAPTSFSHDPQGNYPGDHRSTFLCSTCHGNIVTTPFVYPSSQYAPFCAACHEDDFRRKDKHNGGENGTVEQNKDCGDSGCHSVDDDDF